ncbi:pilus assembly PilX N-terminal domain-containing protein [Fibrobacter sp. UWB12]|uniref:pilus assembly PilX family protein n=1 Tax=Fibrobacter sp. UWB12 TaxID=1896203 RepID=UPI0009195C9F|nr:pilus assembly PilX N-terminal domain-containing protein [Fibrobacter sp. UWB12]SHK53606.1 hypothetical protein SAMN05720759_103314 [Fibrobacter sp. UWB12]
MRKNYLKNRAGVSLITVLMFMLVATIAATATWKFISSEGFSSASRMLKREAYQSAQAGIENARSWMTFHANDVGALIKQFQDHGKAINIDDQLRPLQKAGQNYHVWVTGVNTTNSTYKIKVLSAGESRNETSHTEVAIFNVDGLYRVKLPITQSSYNFSEAFHGALKTIDKLNIDKAIITATPDVLNAGGQAANDITVTDYLILDGSFYANNTNSIKDLYATGDVGTCSGINVTGNLYVGGIFYPGNVKSTIEGTLYTEGGIDLKEAYHIKNSTGGCASVTVGNVEINGNITSNGPFIYYDANGTDGGSSVFTAKSSMVLNSSLKFPTTAIGSHVNDKIKIEHNVYVKDDSPGKMGDKTICGKNDGRDAIPRTTFGSGDGDKVWLKGFVHYKSGATPAGFSVCTDNLNNNCQVDGFTCARSEGFKKWIGYKGQFLVTEPSAENMADWNANKLDKYKERLEERDESCKRAKTPIQVNTKIFTEAYTHIYDGDKGIDDRKGCDVNIWSDWNNTTELLNACYQIAKANNNLYNNDWLILEFPKDRGWMLSNMNGALNGNFIFKFNEGTASQVYLPPTSGSSKVLLYLPDGWPTGYFEFANNSAAHRYFIFSEGNVRRFDMKDLESPMSGSVVAANCSEFNQKEGGNNTLKARFDQELTDALAEAAIICDNDGTKECSNTATINSSASGSSDDENTDRYYISMAPQLGISLESQSKSFEKVDDDKSEKLAPSFIILPRVISLPNDPYGTLGDYLNVITLNKPQGSAPLAKTDLDLNACDNVKGSSSLDITLNSKLFSPTGSKLPKGTYKCNISADGYQGTVPVWVSIDNKELRNLHQVSFTEASQEIQSSGTREVKVRLQPNIPSIDLKVSCPNAPNGWDYAYVLNGVTTGENCIFKVSNLNNTEKEITLFTVRTTGATSGTMSFQILPNENSENSYIAAKPSTTGIYISSTASLTRGSALFSEIDKYCEDHENICPSSDERYSWPDCPTEATEKWVEPDVTGFQTEELNNSWLISSAINTTVKLTDVLKEQSDCVVIIPEEDNSCTFTDERKTCTLHASAKEKVNKIKFKFKNVETGKNPSFTVERGADIKRCSYNDTPEHECIVNVYSAGPVSMQLESNNDDNKDFKYWECEGPSCPPNINKLSAETYPPFYVEDNETVVNLMYNEVDKHCFFDKFKNKAAACKDLDLNERKEYCIDYCAPASHCASAISTGSYPDAKWHLIKGNMNNIDYENGNISVVTGGDITVMSTINADAGTHGSLKAMVRLPKNDATSGFLLGSSSDASSHLMLFAYIDNNGYVRTKLCDETLQKCKEGVFTIQVTENDMVMIEAEITAENIAIMASKGNERSLILVKFDLNYWSGSYEGSFVGFRIANPKFKIYGIGWKSTNYECFNTYPTIKCSFAAVARYGVVPREQYVKPWVGYSGWEGWNTDACTEKYYYIGDDACGGSNYGYTECSNNGYYFDATSSGKHGYTKNGNDIKTAKVGLDCESSLISADEMMWASDSAHCGVFWTGAQSACTSVEKIDEEIRVDALTGHQSAAFTKTVNMRSAQIRFETNIENGSEIWIQLYSEGEGETLYPSERVSMNTATKTFDIKDFITETSGFDPGKVKSVYFENNSNNEVTIKKVITICETAVNVKSCKAEERLKGTGLWWNYTTTRHVEITANINNRDAAEEYQIIAKKGPAKQKTYVLNKNDISVTGTSNAILTLPMDAENIDGAINEWVFNVSAKAEDGNYSDQKPCNTVTGFTPQCKIHQPGPGEDPEVAQNRVEFRATLSNCYGCSYVVTLDGTEKKRGDCTTATMFNICNITIPNEDLASLTVGSSYKFRLYSEEDKFIECEKEFSVKGAAAEPGAPHINSCSVESVEGSSVSISTAVTGCAGANECTYNIEPSVAGYGDYHDNDPLYFSYNNGSGTVTHTLTITKGTKTDNCTFDVTYVASSEESSSSSEEEKPSSSSKANPSKIDTVLTSGFVLEAGKTYTFTGCIASDGNTGGTRIQIGKATMKNCLDPITGTSKNYWNNSDSYCNGEVFVTYPITVHIPNNVSEYSINYCGW